MSVIFEINVKVMMGSLHYSVQGVMSNKSNGVTTLESQLC